MADHLPPIFVFPGRIKHSFKKVLVIETGFWLNEENARSSKKKILAKDNFRVILVSTGANAINNFPSKLGSFELQRVRTA